MKCFYHKSDLDGHCSGAIVKMRFPECEMIGVDYPDKLDLGNIRGDERVAVVDFSFSRDEMVALNAKANLFWCDHHKSALEKMEGVVVPGLQEIGKAGCELTWGYLHKNEPVPTAVYLLGRYDVWDHEDLDVLPFKYGMRMNENTLPESSIWEACFYDNDFILNTLDRGHTILDYELKQNALIAKGMSFETTFKGLRAICINKPFPNSKVFDSVWDESKHDIMIIFGYKPGSFKYNLYSTKDNVDCSEIAKLFGGGGHKGAAGFHSDMLLF